MKKYLMTGMAALAICAAFTSCSKETNVYNPDQPKQDIQLTYEQAFIKAIGQPAANQDWGFGTAAKTRATFMNGNEEKYNDCPTLLTEDETGANKSEETLVYDYVNMTLAEMKANNHIYAEKFPENLTEFFVTHVHTGDSYYNTYQDRNNTDQNRMVLGSSKMNHLQIGEAANAKIEGGAKTGTWQHCNNFNAAVSTDWGGNTLFEESGTYNFAYHNSDDSRYHDKWIVVKGEDIHSSLAGRYYVCFDFIGECASPYTEFKVWVNEAGDQEAGVKHHQVNIRIPTIYGSAQELLDDDITEVTYEGKTYNVIATGNEAWEYAGMSNPNQVLPANNVYTDWIVRIVKATPKDPNPDPVPNYTIGVIGEDLTSAEEGDFDFNDVVFNVALNVPGKTYIKLRAAGGTLPLIIGIDNPDDNEDYTANEVHNLFGGYSTKTMINTGASAYGASADGVPEKEFVLNQEYSNAKFIPVYVKKNGQWVELTAAQGVPASKIGVSPDFRIVPEQVFIGSEGQYPLFTDWVTKNTHDVSNWQGVVSGN